MESRNGEPCKDTIKSMQHVKPKHIRIVTQNQQMRHKVALGNRTHNIYFV